MDAGMHNPSKAQIHVHSAACGGPEAVYFVLEDGYGGSMSVHLSRTVLRRLVAVLQTWPGGVVDLTADPAPAKGVEVLETEISCPVCLHDALCREAREAAKKVTTRRPAAKKAAETATDEPPEAPSA